MICLPLCQPPERQIVVGICAMTKKSKSKPMTQILERLCKFEYITVVIMGEDVILNEPVENWPSCDCLISFHSKGNASVAGLSLLKLWAREFPFSLPLCPHPVFQDSPWIRQLLMPSCASHF